MCMTVWESLEQLCEFGHKKWSISKMIVQNFVPEERILFESNCDSCCDHDYEL